MQKLTVVQKNLCLRLGVDYLKVEQEIPAHMPLEYFLGKAEFYNRIFNVNTHTLIPRVETEQLINLALSYLKEKSEVKFLDVGTGSGCIGLTLGLELQNLQKTFSGVLVDLSNQALQVARQNISDHNLNQSLVARQSDLLSNVDPSSKFDLIIANLPYIPSSRINQLNESVKDFEPLMALDGGGTGLDLITKLLLQAPDYLASDGMILLEVDDTHTQFPQSLERFYRVEIIKDQFDKNRFWVLKSTF